MTRSTAQRRRLLLSQVIADHLRRFGVRGSRSVDIKRGDLLHFLEFVGDAIVPAITDSDLATFADEKLKTHAAITVKRMVAHAARVIRASGHHINTPRLHISTPPVVPLSPDNVEAILAVAKSPNPFVTLRNQTLVKLMLDTGMRIAEALSLKVSQITPHCIRQVRCKANIVRDVVIDAEVERYLGTYVKKRDPIAKCGALFVTRTGTVLKYSAASSIFESMAKNLDIKFTPHRLRHTFGQRLYDFTRDIELVRHALGHRQIETTQRYARSGDAQLREALNARRAQFTVCNDD